MITAGVKKYSGFFGGAKKVKTFRAIFVRLSNVTIKAYLAYDFF